LTHAVLRAECSWAWVESLRYVSDSVIALCGASPDGAGVRFIRSQFCVYTVLGRLKVELQMPFAGPGSYERPVLRGVAGIRWDSRLL
jgi:hypothetical protein